MPRHKLIGNDSLICSDMGGTSFDMDVISRGQTSIENEPLMERFKLNVPTLHLDTIGAGAGMALKVDPLTRKISLGPESAGADPGPICFDRGGTEPTIADCDAILGRLNPDYFLGGKVKLQVEEAAEGMIEMLEADANNALRRVISGQGIHPSGFTLLSYGGSGPLHLAGCSKGIGFKDIITFQFAAGFSAFGCTTADYMRRHSVSTQIDISARASEDALAVYGAQVINVWKDFEKAAVDEMLLDGHARKDQDGDLLHGALYRPARGRRGHGAVASCQLCRRYAYRARPAQTWPRGDRPGHHRTSGDDAGRAAATTASPMLSLRKEDPLKFETLHTKLRAYCVSAREMARRISASPGVREVGEMVVAIYTPEGDAIALSNGIMVHVHTMSRFIKCMIKNGYEENPCIRDGDIFANNDAFIGTVQMPGIWSKARKRACSPKSAGRWPKKSGSSSSAGRRTR